MSDTATFAIELAVGLACLVAAAELRRSRSLWWLAALLAVAGLAAAIHAIANL